MTFTRWSILLTAAAAMFLLAIAQASPQFDSPNRSFHNATAFRLDGKHQTVACEACHMNGQFKGTPTTCFSCHWVRRQDDRFQTRLGTACEQCHRPTSWTAVRWDHSGTAGVALNADHRQLSCESCHRGANFRSAAVTCISCHQKDYSATRSPNHAAANFPVTCDTCHKPSDPDWNRGTFSHTWFPVTSGPHKVDCVRCHTTPNTFAVFSCTVCHGRSQMDNKHQGRAGYVYDSNACYSCHPNGRKP